MCISAKVMGKERMRLCMSVREKARGRKCETKELKYFVLFFNIPTV